MTVCYTVHIFVAFCIVFGAAPVIPQPLGRNGLFFVSFGRDFSRSLYYLKAIDSRVISS
ncbi:hypothetical protein ASPWEDRAFT_431440 [Aspergillus wentii DTO 134E9]|uniref:Uncharacterized protein n=1 Tax=Aspergillus wentii DTO 134E9 TaxID=1073089 RepID=A0A1L9RPU2_ASPWE|nr:uncharacterized protein ASPWEDRAFT_431440 [Aspergillus wentii DTO 134E9]OJJ36837.1 hypothetical protein ASPWEDRAFT_431440 [Aspergillus wentii DTO 134E9]